MLALRITVEAPVCSFRQPHFVVGRQLSFHMPPPSTIYGHVASALGILPDPASFRFAYAFTSRAHGEDLEHQHVLRAGGPPTKFTAKGETWTTSVGYDSGVQLARRGFLFDAHLELYLDRPDWETSFRAPAFAVVLGRSQDLATVTDVSTVELQRGDSYYFEDTILPFSYRQHTARGTTVLMPLYVGPAPRREPVFAQQVMLRGRLHHCGNEAEDGLLNLKDSHPDVWIDPTSPVLDGRQRGLALQSFMVGSRCADAVQ